MRLPLVEQEQVGRGNIDQQKSNNGLQVSTRALHTVNSTILLVTQVFALLQERSHFSEINGQLRMSRVRELTLSSELPI